MQQFFTFFQFTAQNKCADRKTECFFNNQEMMAAMMEGMPLRQLLSFVPGIKRKMLEQMVGALNEGVAYNKKNVSMEIKALCQTRN